MKIFHKGTELSENCKALNEGRQSIGFVPTMGSLHKGHLSLIQLAKEQCDLVICSIFINPTQFNKEEDFQHYPKNVERDAEMLQKIGCDILYMPSVDDIYPNGLEKKSYDLGQLGEVLEGSFRPGHFDGVIEVVYRLFAIVNPDKAFFGMKDFQQLAVIRWMVSYFDMPIEIIGGPIVRDLDGLALSSRNERLSPEERKSALKLSKALFYIKKNYPKKGFNVLRKECIEEIEKDPNLDIEYIEMASALDLRPIKEYSESDTVGVFLAAYCGAVRLIDNIVLF